MVAFTAKIAGTAIAVEALYPETRELFRDYLTEEPPSVTISVTEEQLFAERRLLKETDIDNRRSEDDFKETEMESNFLYRQVAEQLAKHNTVLIHGSAVAVDGEGYLFVAPGGTGKSTHVRLWRDVFGIRVVMINDDKPLLKCSEDGIAVYGSPWNGKHHLSTNISVPLKAICFLGRGRENRIEPMVATKAFLPMLKAVYHSNEAAREACILQSLQAVRRKTAFYRLQCNMERSAAVVSYEGMKNGHGI